MRWAGGLGKQIQGWFLRLKGRGHDRGQDVNDAMGRTAVSRGFNLAHVFQLIVDALDQRPLPEQEFIDHWQEFIFPIALPLGDELHAVRPQLPEQFLADVAAIPKPFAPEFADQFGHRPTVIGMTRREGDSKQFPLFVDD